MAFTLPWNTRYPWSASIGFLIFWRWVLLCFNALVGGCYIYFMAKLLHHNQPVSNSIWIVLGINTYAELYNCFAMYINIWLNGLSWMAGWGIFVNEGLIAAGYVVVAVLARQTGSCNDGVLHTPLGLGLPHKLAKAHGNDGFEFRNGDQINYVPNDSYTCRINKAAFGTAIFLIFAHLAVLPFQYTLIKIHRQAKKDGVENWHHPASHGKVEFELRNNNSPNTYVDEYNLPDNFEQPPTPIRQYAHVFGADPVSAEDINGHPVDL